MATRISRKLEVVEHGLRTEDLSPSPRSNPVIGAEIGGVDLARRWRPTSSPKSARR